MKWLIEAIVDLVYPPEEGEEIPFWRKLLVFIFLVLTVVLAFCLSR